MSETEGASAFNAVAALPGGEASTTAEELRRVGFDGDRLSISGDNAVGRPPESARRARDAEIGRETRAHTATWGAIGAVAGAIIGIVVALALSFVSVTGIVLFAVVGAILLGIVGALVSGYGSLEDSHPSESAVVMDDRRSLVGVHVDTREELDRAIAILRAHGATAIEVFDRAGNRLHAA
jgi:outer membrane lipoprotein SlyB